MVIPGPAGPSFLTKTSKRLVAIYVRRVILRYSQEQRISLAKDKIRFLQLRLKRNDNRNAMRKATS